MKDLESDYSSAPSDCTKPGPLARFTRRYNLPLAALGALIALAALFLSAGSAEAFGSIAIEKGDGKLVVNWNPPQHYDRSKITGYWVKYKTNAAPDQDATVPGDPDTGWAPVSHSGTETTAEITGLTNGVAYAVRVGGSNGENTASWHATATAIPSAPPTDLVAAPGNTKLVVGWKTPENIGEVELASYTVWYKTSNAPDLQAPLQDAPENGWMSLKPGAEDTHIEITGLTNGTEYNVRVKAHYLVGESSPGNTDSPWSATVNATPHEDIIWAAILTVDEDYYSFFGCQDRAFSSSGMEECTTALTEDEFEFEGATYRWTSLVDLNHPWIHDVFGFATVVPADSGLRKGRLEVGDDAVSLDDSSRIVWMADNTGLIVVGPAAVGPNWFTAEGQKVALSLYAQPVQPGGGDTTDGDTTDGDTTSDTPPPGTPPVTLPDNLSVTVSKGGMTTPTGGSSKVTITGDCPPNGGGLRFQMKPSDIEWPTQDRGSNHLVWPRGVPDSSGNYPITELRECTGEVSKISVDGVAPGEKWDVRVYVWKVDTASDFSGVYHLFGWTVPDTPSGVSVTPGKEQLAVKWDEITAAGTGMTVTTYIRWRASQISQPDQTGYAAAGSWNDDAGVITDGPASHTITGLAAGKVYDVDVKAASPMGSSEWVRARAETLAPSGDNNDENALSGDDDNDDPDAAAAQESTPVPVVTFGHEKTGEGEYWASVNEGDALTVTLIFTPALRKDSSIRWYTAWHHGEHGNGAEQYGSEDDGWLNFRSDYVYPESPAARDVALTAGMTSATFTVQTVEDSKIEGDEAFHLHLCGPPPRCEWPLAPPEPHPGRQRIIDQIESTKDHYRDVKKAPELIVTIVDDDEDGDSGDGDSNPQDGSQQEPEEPSEE